MNLFANRLLGVMIMCSALSTVNEPGAQGGGSIGSAPGGNWPIRKSPPAGAGNSVAPLNRMRSQS